MPKTKVAVVGLGGIAQIAHLPILAKMEDVELAAFVILKNQKLNPLLKNIIYPIL